MTWHSRATESELLQLRVPLNIFEYGPKDFNVQKKCMHRESLVWGRNDDSKRVEASTLEF